MKNLLLFYAVLFFVGAKSQIRYETLDSLSISISEIEKQVEGKEFQEEGTRYKLSFPWENFKVYFYDKLGTKALYRELNGKEVLLLTEGIDFSQATGISVSEDFNKVVYIKVDFPEGHLKTKIFSNGTLIETINTTYLEFYSRYGAVDENRKFYFDKMYEELYTLCTKLKINKSLMTESDVKNEEADWGRITMESFIKKHPKSLMTIQARKIIKEREEQAIKGQ